MPSSPAIAPSASSAVSSGASANPFAGIGAHGANGGLAGLFLSFLSLGANAGGKVADGDTSTTTQLGKKGFNFEPTLLVLPKGIANLSEGDLKNLLANMPAVDEKLDGSLLLALTPGTPAAQAIADFLVQLGQAGKVEQVSTAHVTNDANLLTTSLTDTSVEGNILLIATGLAPTDMEHLKEMLAKQDDSGASDIALELDGTDATDTTAIALVMFIPPALQNTFKPLTDNGTDILLPISNNFSNLLPLSDEGLENNGNQFGKYISPFLSNGNSEFSAEGSGQDGDGEFAGSLATTHAKHSYDANVSAAISGKLDNKAAGISLDTLQAWGFDSSSPSASPLMTANAATLSAGQSTLTNPLMNNSSATASHPAVQLVAVMVEKAAKSGSEKAQQELSIQLDPPELGRVQVHLSYEKGEAMKVHLTTEKQETLTLLQRDSHALKAALEQAGVQTDGSSLSFDMAGGDQSFNQLLGQGRDGQHSRSQANFSLSPTGDISADISQPIETKLNFVTDGTTGNVHYSLLV